jgi:hypothetical protein
LRELTDQPLPRTPIASVAERRPVIRNAVSRYRQGIIIVRPSPRWNTGIPRRHATRYAAASIWIHRRSIPAVAAGPGPWCPPATRFDSAPSGAGNRNSRPGINTGPRGSRRACYRIWAPSEDGGRAILRHFWLRRQSEPCLSRLNAIALTQIIFSCTLSTRIREVLMGHSQDFEVRIPPSWWVRVGLFGAAMFNVGVLIGLLF